MAARDDPVSVLPGVGPQAAKALAKGGVATVGELLLHLPQRYQDRTRFVPLAELKIGQSCLVRGQIVKVDAGYGRRRAFTATLEEGGGFLTVRFFHFTARQREMLRPGVWLRCFGEARGGPAGREMVHPEYRVSAARPDQPDAALTPVYGTLGGVTGTRLRGFIASALDGGAAEGGSHLPLPPFEALHDAIVFLHRPPPKATPDELDAARTRIAQDELLAQHLLMKDRQTQRERLTTRPLPRQQGLGRELLARLGFSLTRAQQRVVAEVLKDLERDRPAMRLLQGDVGSGKTVVAAFAAIRAAEHGCQTAVMAPTEILVEQHYENFSEWLTPLGIEVVAITGRLAAGERQARLDATRRGDALVVVGTHALFQATVDFKSLALTIIDEQHRFGVHQRLSLRHKGDLPHQLIMTATPIPRTLTMALYADMDVSVIDELPPGRKPVYTRVTPGARRAEVMERVGEWCRGGRQAYWVCTLIEESEALDSQAAENVAEALRKALPQAKVGLAHGRLTSRERGDVMAGFKAGEVDVLVATTVIEVGVDVPNASLMVIDNAERLGLAQLHQLRGRVGRGGQQSHCVLLFEPPLTAVARQRLAAMRETNDGFAIAEKDLALRGPGDVLGTRQTGEETFRVADLMRDAAFVPKLIELGARLDAEAKAVVLDTWSGGGPGGYVEV